MFEIQENNFQADSARGADYFREEIRGFQAGKAIGWEMKGGELKFVNPDELKEEDLKLFDRIDHYEIDASNMATLERAIKENFQGVSQENEKSRFHFQGFLRNLLMSKWYAFLNNLKNKTLH